MESLRHEGDSRDLGHTAVLETRDLPVASDAERKARKKELKRQIDPTRPLDSWERYRALNDAIDEVFETIDISNRETRFALILMGSLNAFVALSATRTDVLKLLDATERVWACALLGIYAVTALYFMLQAIEALRPRKFKPDLGDWRPDSDDYPIGVRYYEDVVERDVVSHHRAWCDVHMGQLNAELAVQLHSLAKKSSANRLALRRLYAGLRMMTLLVAGLLVVFVLTVWI